MRALYPVPPRWPNPAIQSAPKSALLRGLAQGGLVGRRLIGRKAAAQRRHGHGRRCCRPEHCPLCKVHPLMEVTSTSPPTRLDRTDLALLAAFAVVAVLGTWQRSLMVIDGAVYLAAAWLGNAWDLFFDQVAGRTVSTLSQFGLAWALRAAVGLSSDAFMVAAHALYFA